MITMFLLVLVTITIFISNVVFGKEVTRRATIIVLYKITKHSPVYVIKLIPCWLFQIIIRDHFELVLRFDPYKRTEKIDTKKVIVFRKKYARHPLFKNKAIFLGKNNLGKYIILRCGDTPRYEKWSHEQISDHLYLLRRRNNLLKPISGSIYPEIVDIHFMDRPIKPVLSSHRPGSRHKFPAKS